MSYIQIDAFQVANYLTAIADLPETHTMTAGVGAGGNSGTLVINMVDVGGNGDALWLDGRDQILTHVRTKDQGGAGTLNGYMRLDPEFTLLDAPGSVHFNNPTVGDTRGMCLGQFNPDTGDQLVLISAQPDVAADLRKLNIDTLTAAVGNHFIGGPNGSFNAASYLTGGNEGYWTNVGAGGIGENKGTCYFFDGLTDGIPGETLSVGANVYPHGLMLTNTRASHWDGFARSGRSWTWVDVWTRASVGRLGGGLGSTLFPTAFPAEANVTLPILATNSQSEAPIAGDSFAWRMTQYVPDGDATYNTPKGRLVFVSDDMILSPFTSNRNDQRVYLRFTDFNPSGAIAAPGQSERTHGRIRSTGRWNQDFEPMFGLAGQEDALTRNQNRGHVFDPLRNRFYTSARNNAVTGLNADPFNQPQDSTVAILSLEIDPSSIAAPVSRDVNRTNAVIEYFTVLKGDIDEPIINQDVAWTLERLSTEGEIIDASTFPGTSTVANGPIDTETDGTVILTLFSDGSLLTETTDYTVVASTGVITWVTDQSGATLVLGTYEHRSTPASPAHGSLISSSSTSDDGGLARTSVFYPDDNLLVGTLDIIGVEII